MTTPTDPDLSPPVKAPRWARESDGVEFERVAFFNDAVFAIAMTLLIVAVAVPALHDSTSASDLLGALNDKSAEFVAFFIGFAVLGGYWTANHRFFGRLSAVTGTYVLWVLGYLAFVAWLPFPTALLGTYVDNPVAVSLFAASAAVVSTFEAMLFRQAQRDALFRSLVPHDAYVHAMRASLLPVAFFALSVPVAFVHTYVAIAVWFLSLPGEALLDRYKPAGFDAAFGVTARRRPPS
jgi:uncharacterized membrane protein